LLQQTSSLPLYRLLGGALRLNPTKLLSQFDSPMGSRLSFYSRKTPLAYAKVVLERFALLSRNKSGLIPQKSYAKNMPLNVPQL
jgi:hypothetical protein